MKLIIPTAEEQQQIQNGNIILISKYYLLNYDFIKKIAQNIVTIWLYDDCGLISW